MLSLGDVDSIPNKNRTSNARKTTILRRLALNIKTSADENEVKAKRELLGTLGGRESEDNLNDPKLNFRKSTLFLL